MVCLPDFEVFYVVGTVVNSFVFHVGAVNYNNDVSCKRAALPDLAQYQILFSKQRYTYFHCYSYLIK